jgi:dihydrofolate reductase
MIEGPNGELDWIVKDETIDYADILNEILSDKDIIFYGRIAYEKFGSVKVEASASQKMKDAYNLLNSKKKYVFSKTMKADDSGVTFIGSGIEKRVSEMKQQPGKNIWLYGGAKIATTFFNLNLIDELRLAVHPVILGKGKPLFQDIKDKHKLKLVEAKTYKSGVVLMTYKMDE